MECFGYNLFLCFNNWFIAILPCLSGSQVHFKSKHGKNSLQSLPIGSMYGIFTYIWVILRVNVTMLVNIPYMDPMCYGSILNRFAVPSLSSTVRKTGRHGSGGSELFQVSLNFDFKTPVGWNAAGRWGFPVELDKDPCKLSWQDRILYVFRIL